MWSTPASTPTSGSQHLTSQPSADAGFLGADSARSVREVYCLRGRRPRRPPPAARRPPTSLCILHDAPRASRLDQADAMRHERTAERTADGSGADGPGRAVSPQMARALHRARCAREARPLSRAGHADCRRGQRGDSSSGSRRCIRLRTSVPGPSNLRFAQNRRAASTSLMLN
jgi:hypothetical protein